MKHTTAFRYDEDEARAIQTIINYIRENAPGTNPNTSDAIRYAILNSAAEIRMENKKEAMIKDLEEKIGLTE